MPYQNKHYIGQPKDYIETRRAVKKSLINQGKKIIQESSKLSEKLGLIKDMIIYLEGEPDAN